jgi:transcriptional regulator with XRE-family HTH domain
MVEQLNLTEFAAMVRTKRDGHGLRATATEIGEVSPSTLSRIEQGKVPDLDTFMRICRWLGVSPERFMSTTGQLQSSPGPNHVDAAEKIAVHLRADRTLDPKTADALVQMIRLAYDAAKHGKLKSAGEE